LNEEKIELGWRGTDHRSTENQPVSGDWAQRSAPRSSQHDGLEELQEKLTNQKKNCFEKSDQEPDESTLQGGTINVDREREKKSWAGREGRGNPGEEGSHSFVKNWDDLQKKRGFR